MAAADRKVTGRDLGNIPALDGLRALAALAVVGFHARIPGFADGNIGVDVFFALSGFLITSILISRSGAGAALDYRDFYRRRALRLLPGYFAVVVVCVVLECFYNYGATFKGAAGSAVYAANWLAGLGDGLGTLKHMWSLSIEEQYYLVWPALMMLLLRRYDGNGHLVLRAIAGMVSASWLILAGFALCGVSARFADNATFTRSIELLLGSMLAVVVATPAVSQSLARYATRRRASIAGVAAGVLLLGLVPLAGVPPYVEGLVGWPLIAGLTCAVIYACLHGPSPLSRVLGSRLMTGIGKRSYGVYLWHFPILMVIDARWGLDHWAAKGAGLALTVVVVMLSYRVIERPFLARKNARRPQAAALPPAGELAPANA